MHHSTTIPFAGGDVCALRDELAELQQRYRAQQEPELVKRCGIRAQDPQVRSAIVEQMFQQDTVYHVLEGVPAVVRRGAGSVSADLRLLE